MQPVEISTVIEIGTVIFAAGGLFAVIRNGLKATSADIAEIKGKLDNGISTNINTLITTGAVRGAQLDRIQLTVDKMTEQCPKVHEVIGGLMLRGENHGQ